MADNIRYGTNTHNNSKFMLDLMNEYRRMPRGVFPLSNRKIFDVSPYAIVPFDSWELLPNSDVYVNYDVQMISKNPTLKRLLSGMNVEVRVYKRNYNDCWEGWNNFLTKGRSGKVTKTIPYVDLSLGSNDSTTSLPYSPMDYLRHAPCVFLADGGTGGINKFTFDKNTGVQLTSNLQSSGKTGISDLAGLKESTAMQINALPYVMYNSIVKEYQNANLLQDNPHWFPENEEHDQILPYNATGAITTSDYDNPTKAFVSGTSEVLINAKDTGLGGVHKYESYPWLNVLQFSQRKGDMFNTGSPFPDLIRGDTPTLQLLNGSIDWSNVLADENITTGNFSSLGLSINTQKIGTLINGSSSDTSAKIHANADNITNTFALGNNISLKNTLNKATLKGLELSMSKWRYLAVMTAMRERMALTDGSYNSLVKSMFGHNPQWHNHKPTYCGGFRQPIVFSEVVNTAESALAPLGDTAGRAVSASNHDVIHVHSDDFACYMAVLVITPDEYYSQGVDKMWSRLTNAEQYFPILNNLSPDSTKNKEIYVSGTNADDENVFNYQERFAYYKSRRDTVSGLLSLAISKVGDVGAWVFQRLFSATPEFNAEFNRGTLTDNEKAVFASTDQAQFNLVVSSNMRFVSPIPEDSRPSDMGISY